MSTTHFGLPAGAIAPHKRLKCCRCRHEHSEDERDQVADREIRGLRVSVCHRCGASTFTVVKRAPTDDEILAALRAAAGSSCDGWATPSAVLLALPDDARGISQSSLRNRLKKIARGGDAATVRCGAHDRRFTPA